MLHVSQISREHVEKPSDVLSIGQEIEARIVDFNEEGRKISLSMKAAEENAQAEEIESVNTEKFSSGQSIGTSLGDLFAKLNL